MTVKHCIAIGLMAALPLAAHAQRAPARPDPLDSKAVVPAPTYESAFASYLLAAAADDAATPDQGWRAANDKVAQQEGHAGHEADAPNAPPAPANAAPVDHSKH